MSYTDLTPEEKNILLDKWTERPYTWTYYDHTQTWTYVCKQCSAPLYRSHDKFDSGCGWPSFDDALPNAVKRTTDADGLRTEITCSHCWGHLWHVFIGERMTSKNTRHCVNSLSLQFVENVVEKWIYHVATFGTWCFWCSQAAFDWLPGVAQTYVWYSWWKRPFPNYEQICAWASWHHEVTQVIYDPKNISYKYLLEIFFKIHDPTSWDKQWNDTGSQYRSVIFTHSLEQEQKAQEVLNDLQDDYEENIVTEIKPLEKFRIAESYHQKYFENNPNKPYCQLVVKPKIEKVEKFQENNI